MFICLCNIPLKCVLDYPGYYKNAIDWVAYEKHNFISHGYGDWEIQNQISGRFGI